MNKDLISHVLNWFSVVGVKNENKIQLLDTKMKDIKGFDSLLTMNLISEIETFQGSRINDELLFSMKNLTLGEFLQETSK